MQMPWRSSCKGLVYSDDGTLTIMIQREQPQEATEKANWLLAPEGPFHRALRIYWREQAALHGSWTPPPVMRVDRYSPNKEKKRPIGE